MKVGVALNMLYEHGKHDAAVMHEHLAEGDLVEPLGFNSLWARERAFDDLLAWMQGGAAPRGDDFSGDLGRLRR